MALDPLEWGVIALMAVVLFIWGPQKIPELARALGKAKKEFDSATKEFRTVAAGVQSPVDAMLSATSSLTAPSPPGPVLPPAAGQTALTATPSQQQAPTGKTGDELLIETARKLGISTQGKTREQVQEEIIKLAQSAPVAQNEAPSATTPQANAPASG